MTTIFAIMFASLMAQAPATASTVAPPPIPSETQIAATLLAAPAERRNESTVLGYDASGKLVTLKTGTNVLICLADNPGTKAFSAACYHKDLEPFMARGRALLAQGVEWKEREAIRLKEIEAGTLAMPREPRTLYVLTGEGYDAATGAVTKPYLRWVIYLPFATAESTGLSLKASPGAPWLMYPGTAGAHIMISPPR